MIKKINSAINKDGWLFHHSRLIRSFMENAVPKLEKAETEPGDVDDENDGKDEEHGDVDDGQKKNVAKRIERTVRSVEATRSQ